MQGLAASPYEDEVPLLCALARALEAADVPTPRSRYEWHPTTVRRVLTQLTGTERSSGSARMEPQAL